MGCRACKCSIHRPSRRSPGRCPASPRVTCAARSPRRRPERTSQPPRPCSVRALPSCPARRGECMEPARIAQRHRARSVGLKNAHTGPTGRRGAPAEFEKSMCCAIRVEQGSRTRVPLCTDQARIEQRSKHIAQRSGRKQHLLVDESLNLILCKSKLVSALRIKVSQTTFADHKNITVSKESKNPRRPQSHKGYGPMGSPPRARMKGQLCGFSFYGRISGQNKALE